MLGRILKTFAALGAGHGIQTLNQLLVPAVFIKAYGIEGYGEWLALSAAVGYLSTLDFGLQTYVLNELTALYHRGELEQFHRLQSVGLRLTLGFMVAGIVLSAGVFFLPVGHLLQLSSAREGISLALFCLALQIILSIPLGQIHGVYRTFGHAHRGVMWSNAYKTVLLLVTLILVALREPFWVIALGQCLVLALALVSVVTWLKNFRPEVAPRWSYWDRRLAISILRPSGFFGLFILNNFLVYQFPLLVLQRLAGPGSVVVFSLGRTLFSFIRQGVALFQQALAPELTRLHGAGENDKLVRLYRLSEALLFSVLLVANAGLLLGAPAVLSLWLRRPELYRLDVFAMLMVVSVLASVKEYKLYFQYATNNHVQAGTMSFLSYLVMCVVSVPAIGRFGATGFLIPWIIVESLQVWLVHRYNARLLVAASRISLWPAFRLGCVLMTIIAAALCLARLPGLQTPGPRGLTACSVMMLLAGACYFLFDLRHLIREGRGQLERFWGS